ncbi:1-acyl-sn-glycerol-3-phosphate acyltransferase BAT2 [Durusdinium trenchii]|uniref:1-acyl-sn-glycerol-3-phosphate acyltransferase n=1 Tax=Durusdinium trenchii TaxID=1381693 RepID=A0ABP0L8D3_9DINO
MGSVRSMRSVKLICLWLSLWLGLAFLAPRIPAAPVRSPAVLARAKSLDRYVPPSKRMVGHTPLAVLRVLLMASVIAVVGTFVAAPAICFGLLVKKDRRRKWVDLILCAWAKMTISPFFRVTITGKENLPDDEACVYVANHQSFMDILSAYQLFKPFKFISKASILKFPLIGWVMRRAKTITIEREDRKSQLKTFRDSVDALKDGNSLFVFPEGTRSSDGRLLPFKRGPVSMAKRAKVPIVPMTILGTGRIMPSKKEYLLYQNNAGVKIIVHPKVPVQEVEDTPDDVLLQKLRDTIESALPPQLQSAK